MHRTFLNLQHVRKTELVQLPERTKAKTLTRSVHFLHFGGIFGGLSGICSTETLPVIWKGANKMKGLMMRGMLKEHAVQKACSWKMQKKH